MNPTQRNLDVFDTIIHEVPDFLNDDVYPLMRKMERIKTFKNWPYDTSNSKCSSFLLAKSGFTMKSNKNLSTTAECVSCRKVLKFKTGDDGNARHLQMSPYCVLAKASAQPRETNQLEFISAMLQRQNVAAVKQLFKENKELTYKFKKAYDNLNINRK
uniref:Uncharacterized protein n=1 Tax=Rhabditophanes sp. KR3021 TaxID=114890 RepID=A0AC35TJB2_9BILA